MICTKRKLNGEIERIKKILLDNGYPKNIINTQITKKIAQFSTLKRFGPEKCSVYLRVAWIGKPSANLEKEVKTAVESCYGSVSIRLIFTSKRMLPVAHKDVLFTTQNFQFCQFSFVNLSGFFSAVGDRQEASGFK